jgi:hypothetical protein
MEAARNITVLIAWRLGHGMSSMRHENALLKERNNGWRNENNVFILPFVPEREQR